MSHKFKGILSFPILTPQALANKQARDSDAKYGVSVIFLPGDPQIEQLKAIINEAIANGYPNGFPASAKTCFKSYDDAYKGRGIPVCDRWYDPRFSGAYVLSTSAPTTQKPDLVDQNFQPIIDPSEVYAGAVGWVNCGISKYTKGTGGIGGWLNGVMILNEEPPMGRLDNKPSVEQMFAGVGNASVASAPQSNPPVASVPQSNTPVAPPMPPVAQPEFTMTPKANGATRDQFHAQGWTDVMLIEQGYMAAPGGVVPSFV